VVWYHGVLLSGIYYLRFSSLDPRPGDGLCYQGLKKEGGCNDTILHLSLYPPSPRLSRSLSKPFPALHRRYAYAYTLLYFAERVHAFMRQRWGGAHLRVLRHI